MYKKYWLVLLIASLSMSLAGCASSDEETETETDIAADEEDYGIMTLPLYIGLSVESIDDGVATVKIENRSGYEIEYDNAFSLERAEGDEWVTLQPEEEIAFEDVAYVLPDLEDAEVKCDLNPYGELEDGHYRIEKDDIYAEFELEDGELESLDE